MAACILLSTTNFLLQAALATPLGTIVDRPATGSGDSMILVAVLLCTLLRGVRMQENKIAAITLLTHAAKYCDDDTRLQRIVPYLLVRLLESKAVCPSSSPLFDNGLTTVLFLCMLNQKCLKSVCTIVCELALAYSYIE